MTNKDSEAIMLRTDAVRGIEFGANGVNRSQSLIQGASVMELGVVKDGRFEIDQVTLNQVVGLGNASPLGVKVRFGHPSMSDDALGTFLGRARNFKINEDGKISRADIHFDESSFRSPKGDIGGYVLDLAKNDPAAFGMSVSVVGVKEFRVNKDGTKQADESGVPLPPLLRVKKLGAVDFVDSPAATNGLFAMNEQTLLSAEAMNKLSELMDRPDFVRRAYAFFSRAFDEIETAESPQHKPEEEKENPTMDQNKLVFASEEDLANHKHVQALLKQEREAGVKQERERVTSIVGLAVNMPCDVNKEMLAAINDGHEFSKAENTFLRVELSQRGKESNKPTGIKGDDDMTSEDEKFSSYQDAWMLIKRTENCSTQEAMSRAQDRYPKLFKEFLDGCPRKKE